MALHLLLFTSDAKTALVLGKLLSEFDIEVEFCSEILASVEKVTRDNFDAIVVDWDDGPEATFLLKTARELKATRESVVLALVSEAAGAACAVQIGAHGVLHKPIVAEQIRESMGTIRELILSRQSGTAASPPSPATVPPVANIHAAAQGQQEEPVAEDDSATSKKTSDRPSDFKRRFLSREPRELPPLPPMPKDQEPSQQEAYTGTLFSSSPYLSEPQAAKSPRKRQRKAGTRIVVMAAVLLAAALLYVWAPGSSYLERLTTLGKSAFIRKQPPQKTVAEATPAPADARTTHIYATPQPPEKEPPAAGDEASYDDSAANIQVIPMVGPSDSTTTASASSQPAPTETTHKPDENQPAITVQSPAPPSPNPTRPTAVATADHSRVEVPQSLRLSNPINPIPPAGATPAPPPPAPSSLTPIVIPEETAKDLLVKKVQPTYPEQALRAGVQGAVVLQAWIAKDGSVRDVKLVRGSFVLARAAVEAVKQWQYKPYFVNGQAVEAQTFITVNFRLPSPGTNSGAPSVQAVSSVAPDSPKP